MASWMLDECLETLRRKGAALLGCACALGAPCAGAEVVAAMDRFGRRGSAGAGRLCRAAINRIRTNEFDRTVHILRQHFFVM
ncbi:hypothetical protein [Nocardia sp. NPDC004860]|uniref:hypothetical protein n=1 Tax=Nocardia sp. NPDC004860 TaxID=3154557 RepID=UPI0033AADD16